MRKAFTVIEVLVVVALICILIAVLLPSLARARELALQRQQQSTTHVANFVTDVDVTKITFEGHQYLFFGARNDHEIGGVVHDPNCPFEMAVEKGSAK